jgi:hypothetical protein
LICFFPLLQLFFQVCSLPLAARSWPPQSHGRTLFERTADRTSLHKELVQLCGHVFCKCQVGSPTCALSRFLILFFQFLSADVRAHAVAMLHVLVTCNFTALHNLSLTQDALTGMLSDLTGTLDAKGVYFLRQALEALHVFVSVVKPHDESGSGKS